VRKALSKAWRFNSIELREYLRATGQAGKTGSYNGHRWPHAPSLCIADQVPPLPENALPAPDEKTQADHCARFLKSGTYL
jgi:hypothetical protein